MILPISRLCFIAILILSSWISCRPSLRNATSATELVVSGGSANGFFLPLYSILSYDRTVTDLVYESLYKEGAEGSYIAVLASEDFTLSSDRLEYDIKLRDDSYFSDGTRLTAYDVAHSYNLLAHQLYLGPYRFYVTNIEGYEDFHQGNSSGLSGITIIDDYHIKIKFTNASLANRMTLLFPILSTKSYLVEDLAKIGAKARDTVGSGPYILSDYKAGKHIILTINKFFRQSEPDIKKIKILLNQGDHDITMLMAGHVDLIAGVSQAAKIDAASSVSYLKFSSYMRAGYNAIFLNTELGPTRSVNIRQALNYGLNRHLFQKSYLGARSVNLAVPVNPNWVEYDEELVSQLNDYNYDDEHASKILESEGYLMLADGYRYRDNQILEIVWLTTQNSAVNRILIPIITNNYLVLGIKLHIVMLDQAAIALEAHKAHPIYHMISQSVFEESKAYLAYRRFYAPNGLALVQNLSRLNDKKNQFFSDKMISSKTEEEFKYFFDQWIINLNRLAVVIVLNGSYYTDIFNGRLHNFSTMSSWTWRDAIPLIQLDIMVPNELPKLSIFGMIE